MYLLDKESKCVERNGSQSTPELCSSEIEKTLSVPNHNGSLNILAYPLNLTIYNTTA